jgi:hypothetical protein
LHEEDAEDLIRFAKKDSNRIPSSAAVVQFAYNANIKAATPYTTLPIDTVMRAVETANQERGWSVDASKLQHVCVLLASDMALDNAVLILPAPRKSDKIDTDTPSGAREKHHATSHI